MPLCRRRLGEHPGAIRSPCQHRSGAQHAHQLQGFGRAFWGLFGDQGSEQKTCRVKEFVWILRFLLGGVRNEGANLHEFRAVRFQVDRSGLLHLHLKRLHEVVEELRRVHSNRCRRLLGNTLKKETLFTPVTRRSESCAKVLCAFASPKQVSPRRL